MDIVTFLSQLINSLSWPIVTIILVIYLRKPLSKLLLLIVRIKFKDLDIWFRDEIASIKSETPINELPEIPIDENRKIKELAQRQPVQAVLNAWQNLEKIIYDKLKELFPKESLQYQRLTPDRAYTELFLTGAMPPATKETIERLNFLRNQLVHHPKYTISSNDAMEYISLTKRIQNKIENLTELPTVKLTPLTLIILEINYLIDTGKYNDISLQDIKREIGNGIILRYLQQKAGQDVDFSIILNGTTYPRFEEFYVDYLQRMCNAYSGNERKKWGIENMGLCLLLAWTNEIVQQGSGWHPHD